jgi:hypothetical protein
MVGVCLTFYKHGKLISTVSHEQVRIQVAIGLHWQSVWSHFQISGAQLGCAWRCCQLSSMPTHGHGDICWNLHPHWVWVLFCCHCIGKKHLSTLTPQTFPLTCETVSMLCFEQRNLSSGFFHPYCVASCVLSRKTLPCRRSSAFYSYIYHKPH